MDSVEADRNLSDWLEAEAKASVRARFSTGEDMRDAGLLSEEMDGMQIVQGMLDGSVPQASISTTLGYVLVDAGRGTAVFQGTPAGGYLNPQRTVHGGWAATLLDSALGCAVRTVLPPGQLYTTADLNVRYIKALTLQARRVRAEGRVLHCGRQLATAEARLVGPDGALYAHATATCLVYSARR